MLSRHTQFMSRRHLLQFIAASPFVARNAFAEGLRPSDPMEWAPRDLDKLIDNPKQALDVFDFEPVMKKNVPPAHFGYMATGVDDEVTLRSNREGFRKIELRPRRLVDVSKIDMSAEILGVTYDTPIVLAPTGSNRAFHPDGETAVAKAAKTGNHLQILSTVATTSIEDAIAARGAPVWFQLYTTQRWEVAESMVKRAEAAGAPAIVLTLDVRSPAKWETFVRLRRTDTRDCGSCHGLNDYLSRKPNFTGIDLGGVSSTIVTNLTWERIKRLREMVKGRLVLKGILAAEDAKLAADIGVDAIVVSNHGGRVEDGVSATIDVLPEIVAAVGDGMPVMVDSGFRRGSDIVKALALGAQAVCIGRPYLWGLGAFGQAGVERVLEMLRFETRNAMQQLGAPSLKDLTPAMVRRV
ncbi:alpha-hydroxy acid oxidase [Bradyrhizobium lablabi]|uniref:alpha-hydroxy acid oxidase n=1 Tax=Bradyrhizobium lablabi TaxID=722472 RepID=UPI001BAC82C3|nr:alpha-hydroxy acid oxidase [Bradyrhizobium lablabi]MBR0693746.1 alpha-hydroxy-acid oxidizing protein [Bradyrhizobium lablabi]